MKVKFLTPVQHDAESFQPGDTADLPTKAANALIECGAVELFDASVAKAEAKVLAEAEAQSKEQQA